MMGRGHVEVVRTRWGGAFPSSLRQKENENMTGRAGTLPIVFKWQECNKEGHTPPRCVKKDRRTRWGGHQPSPSCWSSKNVMRRGIPPPRCIKREVKTRVPPSPSWNSNNATRRGTCPSSSCYGNDTGRGCSLPMRCGPIREVSKLLLKENLQVHLYARPLNLVSTSTSTLYSLVLVLVAL